MKLYDVPRESFIKVIKDIKIPPSAPRIVESEVLKFHHIDGMYSLCSKLDGTIVHLAAWSEVELIA